MINPVHSLPAAQTEAAAKPAPQQNVAPQQSSLPQDKVTLSPQAHAQIQAQAHSQQAPSVDKDHDGDRK